MTENELKMAMRQYQKKMIESLDELEASSEDHEFSPSYEKKMKKLFWTEKYFGNHVRTGYAMRKVAMVAMVALSLVAAGTVSAKVFDFRPWEYLPMFQKDEQKNNDQNNQNDDVVASGESIGEETEQKIKGQELSDDELRKQHSKTEDAISDGAENDADTPVEKINWDVTTKVEREDGTYNVRISEDSSVCWITGIKLNETESTFEIPDNIDDAAVVRLGSDDENEPAAIIEADKEKVKEVILPSTIQRIEDRCFEGFSKLKRINLPDQIRKLPKHLFKGCYEIEQFGLDGKNSHYENINDFIMDKKTDKILYTPWGADKLVLPGTVKTIEEGFMRKSKAKEIVIPDSVTAIEKFALDGPELESITLLDGNKKYIQIDDCICTEDSDILIAAASKDGVIKVPELVTTIGDGISIGSRSKLKTIVFPEATKLFKKGWQSIFLCSNWKDVTLEFKGKEPPEIDEYDEYTAMDENGKEITFSGDEMKIENEVIIPGVAENAFTEWEYELPNLKLK